VIFAAALAGAQHLPLPLNPLTAPPLREVDLQLSFHGLWSLSHGHSLSMLRILILRMYTPILFGILGLLNPSTF